MTMQLPEFLQGRPPRRDELTIPRGDALYNTSAEVAALIEGLAIGGRGLIWKMTIAAQQFRCYGWGSPALPQNQGYIQFCAADQGTNYTEGDLELVANDANGTRQSVGPITPTNTLHVQQGVAATRIPLGALSTNRNLQYPLPFQYPQMPIVGQDSVLELWYTKRSSGGTTDAVAFLISSTLWI